MADSTIYISTTTRAYTQMLHSARNAASGAGEFAQALDKAADLEAYKDSVRTRVSLMELGPSRVLDDVTIDISDEGYAAMQADPGYEAWVLDTIRYNLTWPDPYASVSGGNSIHMRFGATKEAYRADAWRKGSGNLEDLTGNKKKSYWEERAERQEKLRELSSRIAELKAREKHACEAAGKPQDSSEAASEILSLLLMEFLGSF